MKQDILFMNDQTVNSLVGDHMDMVLEDVEKCLSIFDKGEMMNPAKCVMRWGTTAEDENTYGRINAMPGYIGGEYNMAGIKWIGSGPQNYKQGLPRASVTVILNDPDTKMPVCISDATKVSAMRTGAVGGLAAKYLARKNSKVMLICGAGPQGRTQLEATLATRPSLEKIYIYDVIFERSQVFAEEMHNKFGVTVIPTMDVEAACREADIITTITIANDPIIHSEWVKKGALMIQLADYEMTYQCVKMADKIVVDTWDGVRHRMVSTLALMYRDGLIKEEDIDAELGSIINGRKPGRESEDETIYFNAIGMGLEDLCVVTHAYRLAMEQGKGQIVNYWAE